MEYAMFEFKSNVLNPARFGSARHLPPPQVEKFLGTGEIGGLRTLSAFGGTSPTPADRPQASSERRSVAVGVEDVQPSVGVSLDVVRFVIEQDFHFIQFPNAGAGAARKKVR